MYSLCKNIDCFYLLRPSEESDSVEEQGLGERRRSLMDVYQCSLYCIAEDVARNVRSVLTPNQLDHEPEEWQIRLSVVATAWPRVGCAG